MRVQCLFLQTNKQTNKFARFCAFFFPFWGRRREEIIKEAAAAVFLGHKSCTTAPSLSPSAPRRTRDRPRLYLNAINVLTRVSLPPAPTQCVSNLAPKVSQGSFSPDSSKVNKSAKTRPRPREFRKAGKTSHFPCIILGCFYCSLSLLPRAVFSPLFLLLNSAPRSINVSADLSY